MRWARLSSDSSQSRSLGAGFLLDASVEDHCCMAIGSVSILSR